MNNCCRFNWFSTFVLHKTKTNSITEGGAGMMNDLLNTIDELQIKLNDAEKEIENLKYNVQYLTDCGIEKEHQYKETLRKCSPYTKTHTRWIECIFCGMDEHTDDCEYVKLTGGEHETK